MTPRGRRFVPPAVLRRRRRTARAGSSARRHEDHGMPPRQFHRPGRRERSTPPRRRQGMTCESEPPARHYRCAGAGPAAGGMSPFTPSKTPDPVDSLRYHGTRPSGAQTKRRGGAGAVRDSLGGKTSPAALFTLSVFSPGRGVACCCVPQSPERVLSSLSATPRGACAIGPKESPPPAAINRGHPGA